MVALQEDRPAPAGADRRRQDDRRVLGGALVGVGHLALGDLEDHRARVARERFGERLSRGQVGRGSDVDGGHREARRLDLAPAAGQVQLMDRRRWAAERLARLPDQPAGGVAQPAVRVEDRLEDELVDDLGAEGIGVVHRQAVPPQPGGRREAVDQLARGRNGHELMLAKRGDDGECQQERNRRAKDGGEDVPLARRGRITKTPLA